MSTKSGGPKTTAGKAVTRYNAATHGIYSVTPVLPKIERQSEWLDHRARVFADLAPDGYVQEIIAERIALNSWRLRRLVRFEREQVRNRHRGFMDNLKAVAIHDHRELQKEPLDSDLDLLDRWSMDALIPREKELMLLMRYEGRLTRHLRLDLLHLEHMKRQRRERQPLWSLAGPEEDPRALRPAAESESPPVLGFAERDPKDPALRPVHPESLGDGLALRQVN